MTGSFKQKIRFCHSADGVRLAYATTGSGPPLVKAANYLTHLEHDWPVWRHWLDELSSRHTLIRYDERGSGLSDREVEGFSMAAWLSDLEAVVEAAKLKQFPLLGISQGASVGVAYAVKHPEKVSHLLLYGGYARGRFHRGLTADENTEAEMMINAIRLGWGKNNPAFRQLFSMQLMPEATAEQWRQLNELARVSAAPETAARMERAFYEINVADLAAQVSVPTLVLHARDDSVIAFEEGRRLAALIPHAEFVPLDSKNHILLEHEPAWRDFCRAVDTFLGTAGQPPTAEPFPELTVREQEVLTFIARGYSNGQIAARLSISERTVRNHVTHIFEKLGVTRRPEAIVKARDAGFGMEADKNP